MQWVGYWDMNERISVWSVVVSRPWWPVTMRCPRWPGFVSGLFQTPETCLRLGSTMSSPTTAGFWQNSPVPHFLLHPSSPPLFSPLITSHFFPPQRLNRACRRWLGFGVLLIQPTPQLPLQNHLFHSIPMGVNGWRDFSFFLPICKTIQQENVFNLIEQLACYGNLKEKLHLIWEDVVLCPLTNRLNLDFVSDKKTFCPICIY